MNDLKGIIDDCNKSDLVSDKVIKKVIEIIGQEEWQDLHDENNDVCTTMGELIITLKGIAELEKENERLNICKFEMNIMLEKRAKEIAELKSRIPQWHNLQEDPTDLPKCGEDEQIIFYVKEWYEDISKYRNHYCLGFYKKAFLNDDVKVFVERSKGYENEHLPVTVLRWRVLEKWEIE